MFVDVFSDFDNFDEKREKVEILENVRFCPVGCARCAQCAGMSLALTAVFSECFAEVCAHLQNVSDSVAELDAPRNRV